MYLRSYRDERHPACLLARQALDCSIHAAPGLTLPKESRRSEGKKSADREYRN